MIKTIQELKLLSDLNLINLYDEISPYKEKIHEHFITEIEFEDIIIELFKRGYVQKWVRENNIIEL